MTPTVVAILSVFSSALLAALTYATATGGKALSGWLQAREKGSIVAREALVLEDLALAIVQDIESNEKAALASKAPGEPLSMSDARQLKDLALTRLKAVLQARGLEALQAMLGALTTNPAQLDTVLSGKVELAVAKVAAGQFPR